MTRACLFAVLLIGWTAAARAATHEEERRDEGGVDADDGDATQEPVTLEQLLNLRLSASSFFEVAPETALGASTIIDRRKLAESSARTLADTIEMAVPGMQIARHLWTGAVIGVRGITIDNNAKTLVMLDGLNLNMRTHFGTHGLLSLPLLDDVDGLEVSLGPGALVHGAGAINGYVNLRPKDGAAYPGFASRIEVGPFDSSGTAQLSYGLTYGKSNNLFVYAGFAGAAGFAPRSDLSWSCTGPDKANNTACPYDYIRARDMGPTSKLSLNWNHGGLNLLAMFVQAQLSTEGNALYDWFNFEDPQWLSTILALRPEYTHSFSDKEDLVVAGTFMLQDFGFVPRHPRRTDAAVTPPIDINGTPRGGRESWYALRALWRTIRMPMHALAAGGEVGARGFGRAKQYFARTELLGLEEVEFNWLELAAFVEDTFTWRNLSVTGGVRFEFFNIPEHFQADTYTEADTKETVTPKPITLANQRARVLRFGLAWAARADTTLKASYQEGFRNPDAAYYTHWAARAAIKERMAKPPLPPLGNETMDSFELDLHERLGRATVITAAAYYNRYRKLLAWNATEDAFLNSADDVRSIGGELGVEVVAAGARVSLSYGHARPLGFSDVAYAGVPLTDGNPAPVTAGGHSSWKAFSPHQIKMGVSKSLRGDRLMLTVNSALFAKVHDPGWAAGQHHRLLVGAAAKLHITSRVYAKLVLQNLTGNTVPAARIDNNLTQVGNLGIEQRLLYLSLGLTTN